MGTELILLLEVVNNNTVLTFLIQLYYFHELKKKEHSIKGIIPSKIQAPNNLY